MKALVLNKIGELEYKDAKKPVPAAGEVLVRVCATGICGSDIPRAYREGAHRMPLIIGHEFAGCVEETGEGVSSELAGKRVGIFPLIPCKKCAQCKDKKYEMCKAYSYLGSRRDGGFAEYVSVPAWNLIELPSNVSYEAAAMLEPMSVAVHAMRRVLDDTKDTGVAVNKDATVAVCGLGTIGVLLVQFLLEAGYRNLIVLGNKDFQKKMMSDLGVPEGCYCDTGKESAYDLIMDHTAQRGADVFFECVGKNETASLAIDCAAAGGRICFVGNPHSDMTFEKPVYWKILRNQLKISGTWNSSFLGEKEGMDDDWHYVLSRLENETIHPEKLITHKYPLKDIIKGFELMRDKSEDYIKVMYSSSL